MPQEKSIIQTFHAAVLDAKFKSVTQNANNYGYPYVYAREGKHLYCRFVDSVFLEHPEAWSQPALIVTDNHVLKTIQAQLISVLPEFWHIWHFEPQFEDRAPVWTFNCFMNRPRGDRSRTWYELLRRNMLMQGLISFNVDQTSYQQQFESLDDDSYQSQHNLGLGLVPYNNLSGTLEQCIIDSKVSLILETYIADDHIVFSEKIFRCLQMPRPWLLYCSPGSVGLLRQHGFDVMDDIVDHDYDTIVDHNHRLTCIIDHLETFKSKNFSPSDFDRFWSAMTHNQNLLKTYKQKWNNKFTEILNNLRLA